MRAYNTGRGTAIFRLQEPGERLFNSAHIYLMKIPYDRETIMLAHREVVRANHLESCYLRPIAFYGSEKMGVSPKGVGVHAAIAAGAWGAYLGPEALEKGLRATHARAKLAPSFFGCVNGKRDPPRDGLTPVAA